MYSLITDKQSVTIRRENADGTISLIPSLDDNTDYQAYLAWLAEGNQPEPWNG